MTLLPYCFALALGAVATPDGGVTVARPIPVAPRTPAVDGQLRDIPTTMTIATPAHSEGFRAISMASTNERGIHGPMERLS